MKHLDKVGTVVKAAIFCVITAPFTALVFSVCIVVLDGQFKLHMAHEFPAFIILLFLFMSIPAGACGSLVSIYLMLRTKHIGLGLRMFAEVGVLGVALSVFCSALTSRLFGLGLATPLFFSFWIAVGVSVSILYAGWFRKSMLSTAARNAPPDNSEANTTQP